MTSPGVYVQGYRMNFQRCIGPSIAFVLNFLSNRCADHTRVGALYATTQRDAHDRQDRVRRAFRHTRDSSGFRRIRAGRLLIELSSTFQDDRWTSDGDMGWK